MVPLSRGTPIAKDALLHINRMLYAFCSASEPLELSGNQNQTLDDFSPPALLSFVAEPLSVFCPCITVHRVGISPDLLLIILSALAVPARHSSFWD